MTDQASRGVEAKERRSWSMLSTQGWLSVDEILVEALELPVEDRGRFLDDRCGRDSELRCWVDTLLARDSDEPDWPVASEMFALEGAGPEAGTRVGPYTLLRKLGEGGMATVFEAVHDRTELDRRIALKLLKMPLRGSEHRWRFRNEGRLLARLEHPGIARVYDAGEAEGVPFLAIERVDGQSIDRHCSNHRLSARDRVALLAQVCEAVSFAHRNLVVHRDIKPNNVMVSEIGEPKLLDFGIAKLLEEEEAGDGEQTRIGEAPLTPAYASPEQRRGEPATTATDVYSLGALAYRLLAGRAPFERPPRDTTAWPPTPSQRRFEEEAKKSDSQGVSAKQLKGDLDLIVMTAMAPDPSDRYRGAGAMASDLRAYLAERPIAARRPTPAYRLRKLVARHPIGATLSASALATIVLLAVLLAATAVRASRERDRATLERDSARETARFLTDMFRLSSPAANLGETLTARVLLDQGAERIETELVDQPLLRARLQATLGEAYLDLRLLAKAGPLLERSLAARRTLENDPPELARAILLSARFQQESATDLPAAEALAREAIALLSSVAAPSPRDLAEANRTLGTVLARQGRTLEAHLTHQTALRWVEELREPDPGLLGDVLFRLANQEAQLHQLEQSAQTHHRAAVALLAAGEESRPVFLLNELGMANVQRRLGQLNPALERLERALAGQRQIFGDNHPELAATLVRLALTLQELGDAEAAEAAGQEALEIQRAAFGDEHLSVAHSLNLLSHLWLTAGDPGRARQAAREAVGIGRRHYSGPSSQLAPLLLSLARAELVMGDAEAARSLYDEMIASMADAYPPDHPRLIAAITARARVQVQLGELEEAAQALREARRRLEEAAPPRESELQEIDLLLDRID